MLFLFFSLPFLYAVLPVFSLRLLRNIDSSVTTKISFDDLETYF